MQRDVDDTQARPRRTPRAGAAFAAATVGLEVKHHRVVGNSAILRQDLGVPRMNDAGLMEGQLVERQRGDRIDPAAPWPAQRPP